MGFTIRGHYAISFTENASNLVFSEVESPMRISYFIDDNVIVDNVELHPDANGELLNAGRSIETLRHGV